MDEGVTFAGVKTRNEGVKVTGKLGLSRPSDDRAFQVRGRAHQAHAEDHHPGAVGALWPADAPPIDEKIYPKLDEFFDDLGQAYKKAVRGFADAGCRYLQLDEVFIAMLCDPEISRADESARRRSGQARAALWRSDQRGDVGYSRPT